MSDPPNFKSIYPEPCEECGRGAGDPCACLGRRVVFELQPPRTDLQDAVENDLRDFIVGPGKYALCAMARRLAKVIDARGDDEPASQTAKAIETLRVTMNQIMAKENNDPSLVKELLAGLQTPGPGGSPVPPALRYPPQHGETDAGR